MEGVYQGDLTIAIPGIRPDRIPRVDVHLTVPEPGAVAGEGGALLSLGLARTAQRRPTSRDPHVDALPARHANLSC